jgi:hypothetical protein
MGDLSENPGGYVSGVWHDVLPTRPGHIPGAPDKYDGEFLRCIVGSTVFGMGTKDSDIDLMGVCIEPPHHVIGLGHFEQHTYRTAPEGVRGGPGDVDCTVYGLRKFMRLAVAQNPSILTLFFVPPEFRTYDGILADGFRNMADKVVSKRCATTFLGYMKDQRERMQGVRGGAHTNRPELVEKYGFDTKYAGHMIRLGFQGIELLETGRLSMPMKKGAREAVQSVRDGKWEQSEVIRYPSGLEEVIKELRGASPLRDAPDVVAVDQFLIDAYQTQWRCGY